MNIKEMPLKQGNGFRQEDQLCLLQLQEKEPRDGTIVSTWPQSSLCLPFQRDRAGAEANEGIGTL